MTLFFFNSNKNWGGGEKWHLETALFFNRRDYRVKVCAALDKALFKKAAASGLDVFPVDISNLSFLNPFKIFRLYRLFRSCRPDAIILSLPSDLKAAGIAARLARVKKIIYRRGSALPVKNSFSNRLIFKRIITHLIANSGETKRTLLANNPGLFDDDNIVLIYNGLDLERFDAAKVTEIIPRRKGCIYIGTAGRLEPEKNQSILVHVAGKLKEKGLDFMIFIAGQGRLKKDIEDLAVKEEVSDIVKLTGFVDPVRDFLQSLDIFVLPSVYEGFANVILETMACGKPVVAFNTSSNPEVIFNNETGLLAEPGNLDDLTDKIFLLAENDALRRTLGANGRKLVESGFSLQAALEKLEKLIRE